VSLITNTFINFDHGILPACTHKLKEELLIDELFMGFLGSMVFMGLTSGSVVSGVLFTKYECKHLILFSLAMLVFCILMFTFAENNRLMLIVSRLISGFFQVFLVVYYPVWVDLFGGPNKTRWLSYMQIGVPVGVFMGYAFTAILNVLEKHFIWVTVKYFLNY
jgi:MFS family permease